MLNNDTGMSNTGHLKLLLFLRKCRECKKNHLLTAVLTFFYQTSTSQEETLIETPRWPYEEEDLLSYIDNEELPVVLLDLLESEHSCLFYSGCIIAQIRDYRQAYPSFLCDTHHVLLRPTNQV